MDNKLTFEKLNNDNYFTWKYRMEMLLKKESVWKAISDATSASSTTTSDPNWIEKDKKAMALIGLSVMDNQLQHIRNSKTAKESWESLKSFHGQKTLVTTTTLMRKLWDLKLTEDVNNQSHIQEITNILQKLVDLGEPDLTEKWKILLSSLPDSYHMLVTALEARNPNNLTFTLVQTKVIDEFTRKTTQSNKDDQVLKIQKEKSSDLFCAYCKKRNHAIADCRKLKKKNKSSKPIVAKESSVNAIHHNNSDNESLFGIYKNQSEHSILDSGATSHATNRKDLFTSLDESIRSNIKVANRNKVQILGKGDCVIKFKNKSSD